MKQKIIIVLIGLSLLVTACSSSTPAATETPATTPTAAADGTIIAEGRLEPIRYAEIYFTTSGIVSEVLVEEGQAVKKGDPLIRLGDASDKNYAAALLELADAQKALNDLQDTGSTDLAQAVIDLKTAKEEYDDAVDYLDYLENDDRIPQTEQRRFLVQTWKGYQYEIKTKAFKGPAPQDWIIEAKNDVSLKKAKVDE
ncbi:MAG TPA: biotin/lipoyl-binding protein, partial [Anaerolineales bacterium]|nr:biotin/lipoyl-binding protein [Anaerolineales bacterium]